MPAPRRVEAHVVGARQTMGSRDYRNRLLYWLIILSYKALGVTEAATRRPRRAPPSRRCAFIFLISKRACRLLARFFIASLRSTCARFIFARIVMPRTGIHGAHHGTDEGLRESPASTIVVRIHLLRPRLRNERSAPPFYPAATLHFAQQSFIAKARIRFRELLRWQVILIFLLIGAAQCSAHLAAVEISRLQSVTTRNGFRIFSDELKSSPQAMCRAVQFLGLHLAWWFPWSLAILPSSSFPHAKFFGLTKWNLATRLLLSGWAWSSSRYFLSDNARTITHGDVASVCRSGSHRPANEKIPTYWRQSIIGLVGVMLLLLACFWSDLFHHADGEWECERATLLARANISAAVWLTFRPYVLVPAAFSALEAAIAIYLIVSNRRKLARVALALAMVPAGLIVIHVSVGTFLSGRRRALSQRAATQEGHEGPLGLRSVSYLNRPFFLVKPSAIKLAPSVRQNWRDRFLSEPFLLSEMAGSGNRLSPGRA